MGLSTKQFTELIILLVLVYIIAFTATYFTNKYNQMIGFTSMVIPYTFIMLYLSFRSEQKFKKVKNNE